MTTITKALAVLAIANVPATPQAAPDPNQPPARIYVQPPVPQALQIGTVSIHYRAENVRLAPVFGSAALSLSPRVGHIHVRVDDTAWVWANASGEPVTIVGLPPGPHRIRLQLMDANHQRLDEGAVAFIVPPLQPAARIIIDPPLPEPLSRGVVFLRYRTEPSSREAHVVVTVDDSPWKWTDASGNPLILQGLTPGSHRITLELADANQRVMAQQTVEVQIPPGDTK